MGIIGWIKPLIYNVFHPTAHIVELQKKNCAMKEKITKLEEFQKKDEEFLALERKLFSTVNQMLDGMRESAVTVEQMKESAMQRVVQQEAALQKRISEFQRVITLVMECSDREDSASLKDITERIEKLNAKLLSLAVLKAETGELLKRVEETHRQKLLVMHI